MLCSNVMLYLYLGSPIHRVLLGMRMNLKHTHFHWLDRMAVTLSGFCVVHCVATIILLGTLTSVGHLFADPRIHEVGLLCATLLGAVALGGGLWRHKRMLPAAIGIPGLAFMASALLVRHGVTEAVLTVIGVSFVACAHLLNSRLAPHRPRAAI